MSIPCVLVLPWDKTKWHKDANELAAGKTRAEESVT
jgi:hypothetical protein